MTNEKNLYIVFSHTSTRIGGIIRLMTGNFYNHASLALDPSLEKLYSCARYRKNVPLAGGFVVETPKRYMCDHAYIPIKICCLSVSNERYEKIKSEISVAAENPGYIIYNTYDALACICGFRYRINHAYTCISFVAAMLDLEEIAMIPQLEELLSNYVIYEGMLGDYTDIRQGIKDDRFFIPTGFASACSETFSHFKNLERRRHGFTDA
ncbi:MAG: hypothetical protein VB118_12325 [Oscillospiraceae bacterium]|nr:hypothetical protein [Oscillospiraceae bacterium]